MGRHRSVSSVSRSDTEPDSFPDVALIELDCPFGRLDSLSRTDLRETAYELFFMSCRSSPGFSSRNGALNYYSNSSSDTGSNAGEASPSSNGTIGGIGPKGGTGMNMVNSRIKKMLGLKARRASQPMTRTMSQSSGNSGVMGPIGLGGAGMVANTLPAGGSSVKSRRPMTSAEIMRQQMRVTEQSDGRLRKTLMRTMVGQIGRKADTIVLPLELLRQLKPSEFSDFHEYHLWQRRQLKILEAGLVLYPSPPVDNRLQGLVSTLSNIIRSADSKPIDTSKNSDAMNSLIHCIKHLSWRTQTECHWADGYPLNVHLYLALLQTIFDLREETVVLDEVDEMVELMKRTWPTLGINKAVHNVCFAWVLFQQYVITGQVEPDLISATQAMLTEVAIDAKRGDRDSCYMKVLSCVMAAMQGWVEKKLMEYHESFERGSVYAMESMLSLAITAGKIIAEDVPSAATNLAVGLVETGGLMAGMSGNRVDFYIRTSMRSAFTKILENGIGVNQTEGMIGETEEQDPSTILTQLAKDTEQLAIFEKETYSPLLRRWGWHSAPTAVAVITLHNCFGVVLKQYLTKVTSLTNELVRVLHSAGKMEKTLIQMVVEDSAETEDGGKSIVKEMVPYDVESIVVGLLKTWIEERLRIGKECLTRAKETESWIAKSKTEAYAQSAFDLMKLAKDTVDEFFEIPVGARDDMVQELADGLGTLIQDYTSFVASCGTRQSYFPTLPPLTRCNQASKFVKLWKKAANPCNNTSTTQEKTSGAGTDGQNPRPSTSRGTQRLYIRINTLHYIIGHLSTLDKSLAFFSSTNVQPTASAHLPNRRLAPFAHRFELARAAVQSAIQQVSEVAAYRLIFLDSHNSFYDGLYLGDVANTRIRPGLRILKQNLTLLVSVLIDRAQPLAVKEVMKASYESFLLVLLAGGIDRSFNRADHEIIEEDFKSLKKAFCTCGEGLVAEEVVDREAEVVEGIIGLMSQGTERLIEEFSIAACEASGLGGMTVGVGVGTSKGPVPAVIPMPPTTARWNQADPNTILRVLCHRNDDLANHFLKRTFQLPKRK